jgi:hypothetical protein
MAAPGPLFDPPRGAVVARTADLTQRPPVARRKRLAMFSRNSRKIRDRLTLLEAQLKPPGRMCVFVTFESPDLPPYAEHLAAFKAENNVGPNDALHTVRIIFAGPR